MGIREEKHNREIELRLVAVRICMEGGGSPEVRRAVAKAYGVDERTVRRWEQRVREGKSVWESPGRSADEVPRERRQEVIKAMFELGPFAGVPTLRGMFPDVPHRFLARMKRRLLRASTRRWGWYRRKLRWLRPGATWATDFTMPKAGLWGGNDRLLLVRDLGSGAQLAAVPCSGEKARVVCAVLLALISIFGAPLLMKHDRGSGYVAHRTQALLEDHGITPLPSPARTPQYNGSAERSGGCFKQRVEHMALLAGHPGVWTMDDIHEAMVMANTTARPFGANGPTPAEALGAMRRVSAEERESFKQTLAHAAERGLQTFKEETGILPMCSQRDAIDRKATQYALCEHGYLEIRRGRLSTPISTWKAGINA
jgi:transposase InsO family protein